MKGDFTRLTFDPAQHFSRVLLQQGRVLLDADFNEQVALSAYALRRLTRDLLGPHAGPAASGLPAFYASAALDANNTPTGHLSLNAGRYYVDGLPAETTLALDLNPKDDLNMAAGPLYLLYLDVWEEHITWLEDDQLREPALGGVDTTTRTRIAYKIGAAQLNPDAKVTDEPSASGWLDENLRRWPRGENVGGPQLLPQLQAWTTQQAANDDVPCVADPAGGYRGLENQLYRVEIHAPGNASAGTKATFKWSRENGSVTAAWTDTQGNDVIIDGIHDTAHGFAAGQWVELTSFDQQHAGLAGALVRLVKVEGMRLSVDPATALPPRPDDAQHPIVRRWDHRDPGTGANGFSNGAIVLNDPAAEYYLEAGIKIAFPPLPAGAAGAAQYDTGDYWLIPARTATADILWPRVDTATGKDSYTAREPDGVEHVYAPLALVNWDGNKTVDVKKTLQFTINPLVTPT